VHDFEPAVARSKAGRLGGQTRALEHQDGHRSTGGGLPWRHEARALMAEWATRLGIGRAIARANEGLTVSRAEVEACSGKLGVGRN
jgi:hypothetical protein